MTLKSEFLAVLSERGILFQSTPLEALDAALSGDGAAAFVGFDATADSLHVGHLLPIVALRWLQKLGHRPIVLLGGATTRVGDPSFRDEARPLLDDGAIGDNAAGILANLKAMLDFEEGPNPAVLVDNASWIDELRHIDFLREVGRHFTVNRMLAMDGVKSRLEREQPLTLLEFNYMVLQAFDFRELARREGCVLQMGGSDQWGNICAGIDLARRMDGTELHGLTTPLLTSASGDKMGKSRGGAVWLSGEKLSPAGFWQFWRNVADADVPRFLRLFTEIPMTEVRRLAALGGAEVNEAKRILADAVTEMVHGCEAKEAARAGEGGACAVDAVLPVFEVPRADFAAGLPLDRTLVSAGMARSLSEARRAIAGGGVRLDDRKVAAGEAVVAVSDLREDRVRLSLGRRAQVLIQAI